MPFDTGQDAYKALRAVVAERTRPILAWAGSGLSAQAGLPTWSQLKETLLVALKDRAATLDTEAGRKLIGSYLIAKRETNPWLAFQILEDKLGKTTYRDTIRSALSSAPSASVPGIYLDLWRLNIRGVLSLNLDRLASRALAHVDPDITSAECAGRDIGRLRQFLYSPHRFVANLHGIAEDTSTWVLTQTQLRQLLRDDAYRGFLEACLSTHTLLFVGITPDDTAVGGHLENLAKLGIELPTHYWLTDRRDESTDRWAESVGIRVIRYTSRGQDHSEVLEFFSDIREYVTPEESPEALPPVSLDRPVGADVPLPNPSEMLTWDAERIRKVLNEHARQLLSRDTEESFAEYNAFSQRYDEPIYRAWYTSTQEGANSLLGYTLETDAAKGAFGRVYQAVDHDQHRVAVKVLLEEIRETPSLLKSFRRGVRSMRILGRHQIDGMVEYIEASEIPAFVVMEWIDGPNLAQAKEAGFLNEWDIVLRIGHDLTSVIRAAHAVPERVLHRDIRPSNVMLRNYYTEPDAWDVVVLDFDLSWHRGAYEKSVVHTSAIGYLAPEQIRSIRGVSTRHGAVDSFGLGMTLLFLVTGRDPVPDEHKHKGWQDIVYRACRNMPREAWASLPERFARTILASTQDEQSARWDVSEILGEVSRLRQVLLDPASVRSAELLAEEMAARCTAMAGYEWEPDKNGATKTSPTGLVCAIEGDFQRDEVALSVRRMQTGFEEYRRLARNLSAATSQCADQLRATGWHVRHARSQDFTIRIEAGMSVDHVAQHLDGIAESTNRAIESVQFLR